MALTLTPTVLLSTQIKAFRKRVPVLGMWGMDLSGVKLVKGQQFIARIESLPVASTYSAGSGGYKNGAQSARSLLTDVPVTVDQWPTAPFKLAYTDLISDALTPDYMSITGNGGYVLGKAVVDAVLGDVSTARFSQGGTIASADFDVDALIAIGEAMNGKTESNDRYLLVNSAVASVLAADQRLINSQWFGKEQGGETIRVWRNAFGFREIREYADLPANSTTSITGVSVANTGDLFTKTAHGFVTGERVASSAFSAGWTSGTHYVINVSADTFQLASTLANAIAGTAVAASADGTGGVITKAENINAIAFERRAFILGGGAPASTPSEVAAQFGIPQSMLVDAMYDDETKTALGMAKWQEEGTGDLYLCPTILYGKKVGRDIAGAVGSGLDYAAYISRTA